MIGLSVGKMRYSELNELKIIKVHSDEHDSKIIVIFNPSKKDFDAFMNKSKDGHLRAFLYQDDLYVWDAYATYHYQLAKDLGIDAENASNLHFFKKGSAAWRSGDSDDTVPFLLKKYKVIRRIA